MLKIAKQLSVHIYDLFISTFLTIAAHLSLIEHMSLSEGNFLDVGCGTGKPLKSIVDKIKEKHSKVVGVDLHPEYTEKAIEMFRDDKGV
jgi:ubiquinone/menaquinone biosynthesis C-methylase UbiE